MRKIVGLLALVAVAGVMACTSEEATDEPMEGDMMEEPQMEEMMDSMPADSMMARDTAETEEEM